MIKSILLCGALAGVLTAIPTMAADFHALVGLHGLVPSPLSNEALAAVEGGAVCSAHGPAGDVVVDTGGSCLIAFSLPSPGATFAVANELPVSGVFIQITQAN